MNEPKHSPRGRASSAGEGRRELGPRYVTLAEAAQLCSTPVKTLRHWLWLGKLRAYRPGRLLLLREDELRGFIESHAVGAQPRTRCR